MKKPYACLTALLAASCLLQPLSALGTEAPDAPSPWAAESVAEAVTLGFVPGDLQGGYQQEITRAEFAQVSLLFLATQYNYYHRGYDGIQADYWNFMTRFLNSPKGAEKATCSKAECLDLVPPERVALYEWAPEEWSWDSLLDWMAPFSDVADVTDGEDGYYTEYINAAYLLGIVRGWEDGTFGPGDPITRQEAACMLERAYRVYAGEETAADLECLAPFSDWEDVGAWAEESVALMVQSGVMDGVGEGLFSPATGYTREQCYTTFLRLYEKMPTSRTKGNVEQLTTWEEEREALIGGFCLSAEACFENDFAAVVKAYYGGLPHGASYNTYYILYKAGGRRETDLPSWTVDPKSFRPSGEEETVLFTLEEGEHLLDLNTGERTPAP